MAVITRSLHPKALWPGVRKWVMDDYEQHPKEYPDIFTMHRSKMAREEDVEVSGFGLAKIKSEGASVEYDMPLPGATKAYVHTAYALGYIVTREELDDNLYKERSMKRAGALRFSFRTTKEIVAANVLNRAFDTDYTGIDGKPLIAADHPTSSGTQSNVLSTSADLTEASLEDMLTQIATAENSRGLPVALRGVKLIVPPGLAFTAHRIMNSALTPESGENAVNAIRSMGMLPGGVVVNHYLTDQDAWFISTSVPDGLLGFDRTAFEFTQDNDFDTMNAKAKGYERYSFGWTDWRGLYGSAGS